MNGDYDLFYTIRLLKQIISQLDRIEVIVKRDCGGCVNAISDKKINAPEICGHPNSYWISTGLYCPDCGLTRRLFHIQ